MKVLTYRWELRATGVAEEEQFAQPNAIEHLAPDTMYTSSYQELTMSGVGTANQTWPRNLQVRLLIELRFTHK